MRHPLRLLPLAFVLVIAACSAVPAASTPPSTAPSAAAAPSATAAASVSIPSPRRSLSPTDKPIGATADYSGVLSMDSIEGGCAYLDNADGKKYQVIYPDGWELRKSPLELIAPDGSVHSKAGDRVSVNGKEATDMVSICQIGPIIRATEVLDR